MRFEGRTVHRELSPLPWRSRGYLPHFDRPGLVQSVTFRLADSLPATVLEQWQREQEQLGRERGRVEMRRLIAAYLDRGEGACHLRDPRIAAEVEGAILHFDHERYRVLGWCIMPNHVHAVVETMPGFPLAVVLHSWKSFTAKIANRLLGARGAFWQREYHDRFIRDERHLVAVLRYVEHNPAAARLVTVAEDWRWSSGWRRSGGGAGETPALPG